jgi:hypothetical protein
VVPGRPQWALNWTTHRVVIARPSAQARVKAVAVMISSGDYKVARSLLGIRDPCWPGDQSKTAELELGSGTYASARTFTMRSSPRSTPTSA